MTSTIVCHTDSWLSNRVNESPCVVASRLFESSNPDGSGLIKATLGQPDSPSNVAIHPNTCTCSWTFYNLVQACGACQCLDCEKQITPWNSWETYCHGISTNGNCDASLTALTTGSVLWAWAATNPTTWTGAKFNLTEASRIAAQSLQDSRSSTQIKIHRRRISNSITVGLAIGVLCFVGAACSIVIFLFRRRRSRVDQRKIRFEKPNKRIHIGACTSAPRKRSRDNSDNRVSPSSSLSHSYPNPPAPALTESNIIDIRVESLTTAQRMERATLHNSRPSIGSVHEIPGRSLSSDSIQAILGPNVTIDPWQPPPNFGAHNSRIGPSSVPSAPITSLIPTAEGLDCDPPSHLQGLRQHPSVSTTTQGTSVCPLAYETSVPAGSKSNQPHAGAL
ncbi:hypothetical protein SISNIDRAFT_549563 [Sistotremastrum niveocremeum HHB9708]|uniref:Uncharacterized protein n=1 Tax=Sistotremastrum niveocremeum HHB9708 TaxID=1314777 RepID=A0A164V4E3_9AGAM|nr:hypothetical protein SISNIDRAFT_549563 [Sistotremastrum niveocremeum HHB9708]